MNTFIIFILLFGICYVSSLPISEDEAISEIAGSSDDPIILEYTAISKTAQDTMTSEKYSRETAATVRRSTEQTESTPEMTRKSEELMSSSSSVNSNNITDDDIEEAEEACATDEDDELRISMTLLRRIVLSLVFLIVVLYFFYVNVRIYFLWKKKQKSYANISAKNLVETDSDSSLSNKTEKAPKKV